MPDIEGFVERNKQARETYLRRLLKHHPRVKLLFTAEPPPYPTKEENYFWRASKGEKPGGYLQRYLAMALYGDNGADENEDILLRRFVDDGYFLIDTSEWPVNKLTWKERLEELEIRSVDLATGVDKLNPKRIVVVKKSIYPLVLRRLARYSDRLLGDDALPFPSHHHQKRFVSDLRSLMRLN